MIDFAASVAIVARANIKGPSGKGRFASISPASAANRRHVELFVRERMPHGYYFFPHLLKEGDEAFEAVTRFLRSTFSVPIDC